ncbi:MAG: hypothetical protein NTW65_08525 [Deltaproteobacteria bacterium]|nr:hypothetical protein [Deltaproteobacteria bacterium]
MARHLYELGISSLKSSNDLYLFASVNLIQDSVEAFLLGLANHFGADIDQNTKFDKYFVEINKIIAPKELPFKLKLLRLNRVRVDAKHYGIQPSRDECDRLAVSVREFFDEVSASLLNISFSTISAIDLLDDGESKTLLLEAKTALESGNNKMCAINCRKSIYLEVEQNYDISAYKDNMPKGVLAGLLAGYTLAPFYARNKQYIDKEVKNPTDYIVIDHSRMDQELLIQRVDPTDYWNIWRLTPEVYRNKDTKEWIVKYDFDKLDDRILCNKIEYIFSTTIDIVLGIHANRKNIRTSDYGKYFLTLAKENVPVYAKADNNSEIVGYTPTEMTQIDTDYRVEGFDDGKIFWHVHHFEKDVMFIGYIDNEHVKN